MEETTSRPEGFTRAAQKDDAQPKFIVLDANVFISDYWLRSTSFVLLRDFLSKSKATLIVPKVVVEEVVNHQREDLENAESDIRNALHETNRLVRGLKMEDPITIIARESRNDPYEKFLYAELANFKAKIPDYSEIPHSDIVKRDLRRRKPFQESGKGYRDTLVWETILRNCFEKDSVTVFITNNVRDFYHSGIDLHKDLKADLRKTKLDGKIVLCKDLFSFTDTYVVPYLTQRKDFAVLVQNNKVPGLELSKVCEENLGGLIEALNESPSVMISNPGQHEPEIDVIEVMPEFQVHFALEVSRHLLLIVFSCNATVFFAFFLSHSDYYLLSEKESDDIAVLDHGWNEHVMRVGAESSVSFTCRLTFNSDAKKVESFEVDAVYKVDEPGSDDWEQD